MKRILLFLMLGTNLASATEIVPIGPFQAYEFVIPERVRLPEVPTQAEINELNTPLTARALAIFADPRRFTIFEMYEVQIEATRIQAMQEQRNYFDRRMAQIEATGMPITRGDVEVIMDELNRIMGVFELRVRDLREAQARDERARDESINRMIQNIKR